MKTKVFENLNLALHKIFAEYPEAVILGEDIKDPYGGAFKVTRGLSAEFPERVFSTPISENAIMGVGNGLSLTGMKPIVEIMFGDFITLAFDQILNFASKSVTMYGRYVPMNLFVRCPIGGDRGYGATHSQAMQKFFIGIPNLSLFEVSPFHDNYKILNNALNSGNPSILFESKSLYTKKMYSGGIIDDLFVYEYINDNDNWVHAYVEDTIVDCYLICTGGVFHKCLDAAKEMFMEYEISTSILIPSQLYPSDIASILNKIDPSKPILIAEESTTGGTWGCELASQIYQTVWDKLKHPVQLIDSANMVIPASPHLEKKVIIQSSNIASRIQNLFNYVSNTYTAA